MGHAVAVAAGPQAGIFQGDAILQRQRNQSFGKGLGESPKTGCTQIPEVLEMCPAAVELSTRQERGLSQGPKYKNYRAQRVAAGCS